MRCYVWRSVEAGLAKGGEGYRREIILPRLLSLRPEDVMDCSEQNTLKLCLRLALAIRRERSLGRAGHWTYDFNRHFALLQAYRAERQRLDRLRGAAKRAVGNDQDAVKVTLGIPPC